MSVTSGGTVSVDTLAVFVRTDCRGQTCKRNEPERVHFDTGALLLPSKTVSVITDPLPWRSVADYNIAVAVRHTDNLTVVRVIVV